MQKYKTRLIEVNVARLASKLSMQNMLARPLVAFVAVEPVVEIQNDIVSDYLTARSAGAQQINLQLSKEPVAEDSLKSQERHYHLQKAVGDRIDDMIVQAQELVTPEMQLSPLFCLGNNSCSAIHEKIECWVKSGVTQLVASIITQQDGGKEEIDGFRDFLSSQPLS